MTDIIDQANDIAQQTIERAIANAPKFDRPSSFWCDDCGDMIPLERRQLGGITRCIDCQTHLENQQRLFKKWKNQPSLN